ncbi:MAG: hypothetical protein P4L92_23000 [Rudaea sp.]|nr:hypothetical protein [Rudaea sp.]
MARTEAPHWYQVRNAIFAGLIVAALVGVWSWTHAVAVQLEGLRVSVESMHRESDGADSKRSRELDKLENAIVRDLNIDEARIAELERCACRS